MAAVRLQPLDREDPPTNGRRVVAVLAAIVVLVIGWLTTRPDHATEDRPSTTHPETSAGPAKPADSLTYQDLAGLQLPVSSTDGPRDVRDGRAAGFTRTDRGAALAAVHLLVRTFPFAGSAVFEPTITEQVVGPDAAALARLTREAYDPAARAAKIAGGTALGSDGGWVAGYRIEPADQQPTLTTRTVAVLLRQSDGPDGAGFVEYRVQLVWQDGDWRLLAPAWGDWRASAHATSTADRTRYRSYDRIDESAVQTPTAAPA